jgi:hypothetical protein
MKYKIKKPGSVVTPVILATRKAEIRRIMVRGQSGQIVRETVITSAKWIGAAAQECPLCK